MEDQENKEHYLNSLYLQFTNAANSLYVPCSKFLNFQLSATTNYAILNLWRRNRKAESKTSMLFNLSVKDLIQHLGLRQAQTDKPIILVSLRLLMNNQLLILRAGNFIHVLLHFSVLGRWDHMVV